MLAIALPNLLVSYAGPLVAAAICVGGLLLGLRDTTRFSPVRTWAIASVALRQALRRHIFWITPPLMLAIIVISQLLRPENAQEAIFQTIKASLFATGLLTMLVTIFIACTNLPKEIENRVIYTVATKPATRLEIIVGKVVGLACVSGLLLLIMGIFTYGYLSLRDARLRTEVQAKLQHPASLQDYEQWTLAHYAKGLLTAREMAQPQPFPAGLQIYAHLPDPKQPLRWMLGSTQQTAMVPVELRREDIPAALLASSEDAGPVQGPRMEPPDCLKIAATIRYRYSADSNPTTGTSQPAPAGPEDRPAPRVIMALVDEDLSTVISESDINEMHAQPVDKSGEINSGATKVVETLSAGAAGKALEKLASLLEARSPRKFYVLLAGQTPDVEYGLSNERAIRLRIMLDGKEAASIPSTGAPLLYGSSHSYGQELRGDPSPDGPVAVFEFRGAQPDLASPDATFELRTSLQGALEPGVKTIIQVANVKQPDAAPVELRMTPENERTVYFTVPTKALAGGDFDVRIRCLSEKNGNTLILRNDPVRSSVRLITGHQAFAVNLGKSLLILWLMSVLVIVVAVFCSTFLSWPIAVMLTVTILMGHWVVVKLGDALQTDLGPTIVNQFFPGANAPQAHAVAKAVSGLTGTLKNVAGILPDISQFPALEHIEAGLVVPAAAIWGALGVLALFGLPMIVLSYIFLKYKEVAP